MKNSYGFNRDSNNKNKMKKNARLRSKDKLK